ncbi:FHA domain-containing protein [Methylomagnum ishizawai]|uniref:FHA domain-containing protein n=1 Tax=Methylomagnum ishizawai TaxID=1760988 RepID=A0A1Y6D8F0_9GAMM|nr:type VI secretion system-associated FHA domain protein [Methylomagnum ishizawai]SMF96514.1 FHA domain-containing protein [Methylomagnum ishizawai]
MPMLLLLNVLTWRGGPPQSGLSHLFDTAGGSVGRSSSNQLRLPDPEGFISRKHGSIAYQDGDYRYTDTSSGGTYFATRNLLLEQDTLVLRPGDILCIGDYEIAVSLLPDAAASPTPDLFQAFLEGAGLDLRHRFKPEDLPGLMRALGTLFRPLAEAALAPSPLHPGPAADTAQSTRLDAALEHLLLPGPDAATDALDALLDHLEDAAHQKLALHTALQAELAVALRRFDPDGLARIGGNPDPARCWQAFRTAYPGLVQDIAQNFLGAEFIKTYQRQLRLLRTVKGR